MLILRSLWGGLWKDELPPYVVYWTLRILMFTLSFVLEDWALQELVNSPRQRRTAIILMASSYVTWTYQTHTFSNAGETLVLLWSLVIISRILENKVGFSKILSAMLTSLGTNRDPELRGAGIPVCVGIFQSNYVPSLLACSWTATVAALWSKVSTFSRNSTLY
jgi:Alg9-like mannosyltransferase family